MRYLLAISMLVLTTLAAQAQKAAVPAGTFQASPCGTSGFYGPRTICAADLTQIPGALFNGSANDVVAINTAIAAARTAGGGVILLPPATTHIGAPGIILKSYVQVKGQLGTTIICDTSPCVTQGAGTQIIRGGISNIIFKAGSGEAGATVIALGTVASSHFEDLAFVGFSTGKLGSFIGAIATIFDDATYGSNSIWNTFRNWTSFLSPSAVGIEISGHYGSSPPAPNQVFTTNSFSDLNIGYTSKCVDLIAGADTNTFFNVTCSFAGTGATTYIYQSDDPTYSTVNNYVDANVFIKPVFSAGGGVTSATFFGGYYTLATRVYGLSHDLNPVATPITLNGATLSQSFCSRDGQPTEPGTVTSGGNLLLENNCAGMAWEKRSITNTPINGATINGVGLSGYDMLILQNAAQIATLGVHFPCGPRDGDEFILVGQLAGADSLTLTSCEIGTTQMISIGQNPFRLVGGAVMTFRYLGGSNTWIQHSANVPAGGLPTTFAGLGTCNAQRDGERDYITDDTASVTYHGTANGGGSIHVPVVCINPTWVFD